MSLVVAMVDAGRLHVCADLRVVRSEIIPEGVDRRSPNYFNGVLKIIPITPSVAIAYAGTVPIALDAVRRVKDLNCSSSDIPEALVDILSRNNNLEECDFLVIDAAKLVITRVREGEITTIQNGRTWIGDNKAYELFQAKLEELGYDNAPNPIAKSVAMMNALDAVIESSTIVNVGEFPIAAFNHNGELQLSVAFAAFGGTIPPNPGLNPVTFSNDVNDDSLIVNLTVPAEKGIAAIGVYLNKFKRGALCMPLIYDEPLLIDGNTIREFRERVLIDHGVELLGGGFE